jgi:hypothetical protein
MFTHEHGRLVDTRTHEAPPPLRPLRPIATDFGIEGPDHGSDDFLKQDGALTAAVLWGAVPALVLLCIALAIYFR